MPQVKQTPNILVVLPGPLGDLVLSTPALQQLRNELKDATITFAAEKVAKSLLGQTRLNDKWLELPDDGHINASLIKHNGCRFDAAVLMRNSFRSAWAVFGAGINQRIGYARDGRKILLTEPITPIKLMGRFAPISMLDYYGYLADRAVERLGGSLKISYLDAENRLKLAVSDDDRREAEDLLKRNKLGDDQRLVVLVPAGAFGTSKHWPAERFAELAERLCLYDQSIRIVLCCAPNETEREIAKKIMTQARCREKILNLAENRISLGGLKEIVRRSSLLVANDTGPCHIAAAFGVPLVTMFGPTDPRWTYTGYEHETRLQSQSNCAPCQEPRCRKDHRCLRQISTNEVYDAAVSRLGQSQENRTPADQYRIYQERFVPLADASGLVHGDYRKLLCRSQLGSFEEVFDYQAGTLLEKPGLGHRQRLRVELNSTTVYIKRYDRAGRAEWLRQLVCRRSAGGACEFDFSAAIELAQNNINIARPIAFGVEPNTTIRPKSFVIFEELPDADALERLLPNTANDKKNKYRLLDNKPGLIEQLAKLIGRMHRAGYCHRDMYLSHIFLCRDSAGEEFLALIDLQRVFRPRIRQYRWQVKDLAQLYYSSKKYVSQKDIVRFMRCYLQSERLGGPAKRLIRAVYRKSDRILRHDHNRTEKYRKGRR